MKVTSMTKMTSTCAATAAEVIRIRVPGDPIAKGRPKFVRRGQFTTAVTPQRTRRFEDRISHYGHEAMQGRSLIQGPVRVIITAVWTMPKHMHRKRCPKPAMPKTTKPDLDNVVKCIDALNGIVWQDDALVVDIQASKRYAAQGEGGYLELEVIPA